MTSKSATKNGLPKGIKFFLHVVLNICIYGVLIWGTVKASRLVYDFSYQIFGEDTVESVPGTDVFITIGSGDTTKEIAEQLEYKCVIKNRNSFFIRAKLMVNNSDPILPGVYKLNTSMNYGEIIEIITNSSENLGDNPIE